MLNGGGAIVIDCAWVTKVPAESVTRTVKLKVALRVGVPERLPAVLIETPSGKAPWLIDHDRGGTPPVADSEAP
jgi:hypothetical protein